MLDADHSSTPQMCNPIQECGSCAPIVQRLRGGDALRVPSPLRGRASVIPGSAAQSARLDSSR